MDTSLDDATVKRLVDTFISNTQESLKHHVNALEAVSMDMARGQLEALMLQQSEKEESLFQRDYTEVSHVVDRLLDGRKVDQMSHNKLSRAVLQAAIDLDQKQIEAYQGEPVPDSLDDAKGAHTVNTPGPEPVDLGPLLSSNSQYGF